MDAGARSNVRPGYRVFGSKPGAYGAGLQALIDEGGWESGPISPTPISTGAAMPMARGVEGSEARDALPARLADIELVAQTQDNREHDILDSDDYYQFNGGLAASGAKPCAAGAAHRAYRSPRAPRLRCRDRSRRRSPAWCAGASPIRNGSPA